MPDEDADAAADRLYALPPEDFTAARDAAARKAPDSRQRAAVKALRRPSVSAWLLNLLAREQPQMLQQLLDLGPALAEAQRGGQGAALRRLGQQRRRLVAGVTEAVLELARRSVSPQVRTEVEQTLEAALADPAGAEAVRSGRLVRPLSYAGFGEVDLDGAVAAPVPGTTRPCPTKKAEQADKADAATVPPDHAAVEQEALDASAALDDAVRACERAIRRRDEATRRQAGADEVARAAADDVRRLEQQLAQARAQDEAARAEATDAAESARAAAAEAEQAEQSVLGAQDAAERTRAALDRARRR